MNVDEKTVATEKEREISGALLKIEKEALAERAKVSDAQSLLLHIPGEIRNKIYSYLIAGYQIKIHMNKGHAEVNLSQELQILPLVSRQIHEEAKSFILHFNSFHVRYHDLNSFLDWMGESNSKCIGELVLELPDTDIRDPYKASRAILASLQQLRVSGRLSRIILEKSHVSFNERASKTMSAYLGGRLQYPKHERKISVELVWVSGADGSL